MRGKCRVHGRVTNVSAAWQCKPAAQCGPSASPLTLKSCRLRCREGTWQEDWPSSITEGGNTPRCVGFVATI